GRIVVVGDGAGAGAGGNGRVNRVAEFDREGFVYLISVVAVDYDADRLRCRRIGRERHCAALGDVVGGSGGGAVGGAVIDGNALGAGRGKTDAEIGVDGGPGIPFGDGHTVGGNGLSV